MPRMIWTSIFVFLSILQTPAHAKDAFEVTLQVFYERGTHNTVYYAPPNNIIKVSNNGPARPIKVVLKNITSSSQRLYVDTASNGRDSISFEMTDERGNKNVVTKKAEVQKSMAHGYNYIGPGQTKEFEILLTEREWNNAYNLVKLGAARLRGRASYKNNSTVIYSDYYTIIIEP